MCAIIDNCAFSQVFNEADKNHKKFKPVNDWIVSGSGKFVYGGTKYIEQLKQGRRARLVAELSRRGKVVRLPTEEVDAVAAKLKEKVPDRDFDDEHIVAIAIVSKCRIVCTGDKRSHPYIKRRDLYPKPMKPPKIYQSARNSELCCPQNIAKICR